MNVAEKERQVVSVDQLQTEVLRLTIFVAPHERLIEPTWWSDLVGSGPETRTSKPNRGELQETGSIGNCDLTLSVQFGRVDWFLTARLQEGVPPERRWAGTLGESLVIFENLMTRWLASCPPLVRLAFGATVHESMPNRVAAYRRLAKYLPSITIDPEGSSDFAYQINRPRKSTVIESLSINRLSKWSAALLVPFRFEIAIPAQAQATPMNEGEQTCRIELDINTDPNFARELPHNALPALFLELKALAVELATQGDVS